MGLGDWIAAGGVAVAIVAVLVAWAVGRRRSPELAVEAKWSPSPQWAVATSTGMRSGNFRPGHWVLECRARGDMWDVKADRVEGAIVKDNLTRRLLADGEVATLTIRPASGTTQVRVTWHGRGSGWSRRRRRYTWKNRTDS
ncbi:hypothetical protein GCM10010488_17340 [Oerskovia jenensis]